MKGAGRSGAVGSSTCSRPCRAAAPAAQQHSNSSAFRRLAQQALQHTRVCVQWQLLRRQSKSTSQQQQTLHYVRQFQSVPVELLSSFLIAVFARDGPNHKNSSPHYKMNIYTLLALLKPKFTSFAHQEFKNAILGCLEDYSKR